MPWARSAASFARRSATIWFSSWAGGPASFFDTIVGAHDVGRGKPHPDLFLLAAQRMGVDPADCLVFEDAPHGIEAARRAGMRAVAIATTLPPDELGAPDHVIARATDFAGLDLATLLARLDAAMG